MAFSIRYSLLGILFGLAVASTATIGLDFHTIRSLTARFEGIAHDEITHLNNLKEISDAFAVTIVDATHKAVDGIEPIAKAREEFQGARKLIDKIWVDFKSVQTLSDGERQQIQAFEAQMLKSLPIIENLERAFVAEDRLALARLRKENLYPAIDPLTAIIDSLVKLQMKSATQALDHARDVGKTATQFQVVMGTFYILMLLGALFIIVRRVTGPLVAMQEQMMELANGVTEFEIAGSDRKDEIGRMAQTVMVFRENAIERARLELEVRRERDMEKMRQNRIDQLIADFRGNIGEIRKTLDSQLSILQSSSSMLGRIAEEASHGANVAGSATSESSENVAQVANAASELTAASREISTQVHKASESVTEAMNVAERADQDVSSLATLAERIGAIVDIINSIAEQTNMLALNATIEAARAGDAGRSFAVVASEVKTLAGQTAKATDEISAQVQAIQQATQQAVNSIRTITNQVSEIQGRTTAIAAAVEEQEASTLEISRAIALASEGSEQVAGSVSTMVQSVEKTNVEAGQLRSISDLIADVSGNLTRTVDGFLQGVAEDVKERRRAVRKAIRQIAVVTKRGKRMQTTAVDMSTSGLRIEAVPGLVVGDMLDIEWATGDRLRGRLVWMKDGFGGIELDAEMPSHIMQEAA